MNTPGTEGTIVITARDDDQEERGAPEAKSADAEAQVEELERTADALRDNLGMLVGELGRRGKRALIPATAGAAALLAVGITGIVLWRRSMRRAQKATRMRALTDAFHRAVGHPERVARRQPRGISKIAIAAAAALASVAARRLAQHWLPEPRDSRVITDVPAV